MPQCRKPKIQWVHKFERNSNGKRIHYFMNPIKTDNSNAHLYDIREIPCRKCLPCALNRINEISIRADKEAITWEHDNCMFITLTVDDERMESAFPGRKLNKRTFQKFAKRLRDKYTGIKEINYKGKEYKPIRIMYCGEYGSKTGRPHYHAIIFNFTFEDMELHSYEFNKNQTPGNELYNSKELEKVWGYGNVFIGKMTKESAMYVAGYTVKSGLKADYKDLPKEERPFLVTPNKPGLGYYWFHSGNNAKQMFTRGYLYISKKRNNEKRKFNGVKCQIPRYFDDQFEKIDSKKLEEIKEIRRINGAEREKKEFKGNKFYAQQRKKTKSYLLTRKLESTER